MSDALEYQRAVGTTEAEIVFDRNIEASVTRCIGAKIQVARRILIKDIDGRWDFLVMQRKYGKHRFNTTGAAQQMTRHGFG